MLLIRCIIDIFSSNITPKFLAAVVGKAEFRLRTHAQKEDTSQ